MFQMKWLEKLKIINYPPNHNFKYIGKLGELQELGELELM